MGDGRAFIDGAYCAPDDAKVSVFDPGFTHSDVIYDVVSVWRGSFFRLNDHVERFLRSCAGVQLSCPVAPEELKTILATCVAEGDVSDGAYVSMAVTRGRYKSKEAARTRNIFAMVPNLIVYAIPYMWIADEQMLSRGFRLVLSKVPRIPSACVEMRYKNYHAGDLTRGRFEAHAAGADRAVHCAIEGYLTEGAGFNLFFAKNGKVYTPARNVLEGITRRTVLDLAQELGIPAEVGDYPPDELLHADEAFITSTAGGIMPVAQIDSRIFPEAGRGPIGTRLREEYWRRREAGWLSTPVSHVLRLQAP
ncbi:MAG: branched-chain amino acid--2-keto-4-methylthiobutyrate aminotransferase [Gammaproteobacteria bacterium]|jgi:branched-chain amino acid aminotransferase|nr:branched-chain amino acid--2-keto-4-methylthiobutyrate aminotransferase [Gammaproteobacteria bacterium]